jgi:hypothetical protein
VREPFRLLVCKKAGAPDKPDSATSASASRGEEEGRDETQAGGR